MSGVEVATKISELVATAPPGSDPKSEGDNHIRLLKGVLQDCFDDSGVTIKTTQPIESPDGAKFGTIATGAITITGTATATAFAGEDLTLTDDLIVGDAATIGGTLGVTGKVTAAGQAQIAGVSAIGSVAPTDATDVSLLLGARLSCINGFYANGYAIAGGNIKAPTAGFIHTFALNAANGNVTFARSNASVAAGASVSAAAFSTFMSFDGPTLQVLFPGSMQLNGNGTVGGRFDVTGNLTGAIIQSSSYLASSAGIWAQVGAAGLTFGLNRSGGLRLFSWSSQWYWDWNESSGDMRYIQNGSVRTTWRTSDGALIHTVSATYKPGGGPWIDSSDARIKDVAGEYGLGLDEVIQLRPVVYSFLGNDTAEPPEDVGQAGADPETGEPIEQARRAALTVPYPNSPHYQAAIDGQQFVGLIAQEVETFFPGMVKKRAGYIDGQAVDDLRDLDTTTLIFALVNAVKTLNTRLEALGG